jgi:hypothetical protein
MKKPVDPPLLTQKLLENTDLYSRQPSSLNAALCTYHHNIFGDLFVFSSNKHGDFIAIGAEMKVLCQNHSVIVLLISS